ncbi:MAG: choice-of-anchor L domain-containing protein, partial [Cryomorphaceae bacterium]
MPVAINTVNLGVPGEYGSTAICNGADINWQENSQYFVNNEVNTDLNTTQFDGFTKVFNVAIPVQCGATYHIKMAIADAVDGKNDSAVFMKSGSFTSEAPLKVEHEVLNAIDGQATEGCSSFKFKLVRNDSTSTKVVYLRSEMAAAYPNVFPDFPDSLVFYPQQGYLNCELPIVHNGLSEGERTLDIDFLQPQVCGLDTAKIGFALSFTDTPPISVMFEDSLQVSCDETGLVNIAVSGGLAPYEIEWDGGFSGFEFEVDEEEPMMLQGFVTDQCDLNQQEISILYEPIEYDPLEIVLPEEFSINCLDPLNITPVVSGGRGDYSYSWIFEGNALTTSDELVINSPQEGTLFLFVDDGCAPSDSVQVDLELINNPIYAEIGEDFLGFCNEEVSIVPEVAGGFGNLIFEWKRNFALAGSSQTFTFLPISSSMVSLEVTDECGQQAFDTLNVTVEYAPIEIAMPADTAICEGRRLEFTPAITGGIGEYEFFWLERESNALPLNLIPRRDETHT